MIPEELFKFYILFLYFGCNEDGNDTHVERVEFHDTISKEEASKVGDCSKADLVWISKFAHPALLSYVKDAALKHTLDVFGLFEVRVIVFIRLQTQFTCLSVSRAVSRKLLELLGSKIVDKQEHLLHLQIKQLHILLKLCLHRVYVFLHPILNLG